MGQRSERHHKKKRKVSLWIKIPLLAILVLVVGALGYAYSLFNDAKVTVNERMFEPVQSIDHDLTRKKVSATEPINVLLLGIDAESGGKGRSDAIMVLALHPENNAMQIISIPRDTRTLIVGRGYEDKINHAYAFGGVNMAVETVEHFLDIDIDFYVAMNMTGLKELVDQLGGITVHNDIEWQDGPYHFPTGKVALTDGDMTMKFVRMRKQDPSGDFGRTKRQREVIQGIIHKGASIGSVTKIGGMIDILGNNMTTNMEFNDMTKLFSGYRNTMNNVTSYQVQGSGTYIDRIYYLIVSDEEVAKVQKLINDGDV